MLEAVKGKRINEYVSDYVVFDLETTGTSTATDDVVEISAVKVCKGNVVDEFCTLVNPQRAIPFYASQVNGITDDMVMQESDTPDTTGLKICPCCGLRMREKSGRYGGFWGCSGYPECRYTENI